MKTKIAALITALLIIFVGAGGVYVISQSKPDVKGTVSNVGQDTGDQLPENQSVRIIEEPVDTRVEDWLKQIGEFFGLEILNIEDASFEWFLEENSAEVIGQSVIMRQTSEQAFDTLLEFFLDHEFEQDAYNLAVDETVQLYGLTKEDMVCVVRGITIQEEGAEESVLDLEIRCGLVDFDSIEQLAQEYLIKQLFSEKYERELSTVYVDIIQTSPEHMSGSVQFIEPDEEQATPGNGGAFLAATDPDEEWVLVFDGNGAILCADIAPYDFPVEMVPECYDDVAGQVVNRDNSE